MKRLILLTTLLLGLAASGPAAAQSGDQVLVRVGQHAGYHRMVIDWPANVPYRVAEQPGQVIVTFDRSATLDLSRYRANPPAFIRSVEPFVQGDRLAVRIGIPNGSRVEHFTYDNKFVLDVYRPVLAAAPRPQAVQPKPAPEPPAPSQAARQPAQPAQPEPKKVAPAPKPVAKAEPRPKPVAKTDYEPSSGESWLSGLSIGPNVSTLGVGGELGYRFNDFVGIRLGANHLTWDFEDSIAGNDFDFGVDLLSGGGVIDIYPFGRIFRVTGGARYNTSNLDASLQSGLGDVTLGDSTFTRAEVGRLQGSVGFSGIAPYAGLGLEGAFFDGHLVIGFDLGVLFQGDPDVDLKANGTRANDPALRSALRQEEREIENGLKLLGAWDFAFYPVVGLSGAFRF